VSLVLVLDAAALSSLGNQRGATFKEVRAALEAARRLERDVVVPAVILAELYRGPRHNQTVDACLSRETAIQVRDTDRQFARLVGGVLTAAKTGSKDMADAHVVAAAIDAGGGVIITGDEDDLRRLSAPYNNIHVKAI
jgi:predicted nucleic acid-binding protein